jgi:hypothetical protein
MNRPFTCHQVRDAVSFASAAAPIPPPAPSVDAPPKRNVHPNKNNPLPDQNLGNLDSVIEKLSIIQEKLKDIDSLCTKLNIDGFAGLMKLFSASPSSL